MGAARKIYDRAVECFNRQDLDGMQAFWADVVVVRPGWGVYEGLDGVASYFSALWQAFPDIRMRCTRYIEDGDDLAIEADRTGTNSGPLPTPQLGLIPEA